MQDGQHKAGCFTRTGLGDANHVMVLNHLGDNFGLNGGGMGVTLRDNGTQ